jgi:hypothetical protein
MYVAGRSRACPNPRFNMGALIDMLKGYGLQVQDIEAGGKYRDGRQALRQQSVDVLRHCGQSDKAGRTAPCRRCGGRPPRSLERFPITLNRKAL